MEPSSNKPKGCGCGANKKLANKKSVNLVPQNQPLTEQQKQLLARIVKTNQKSVNKSKTRYLM